MARLPQPGSDQGVWGDVLNEYLLESHAPSGLLKNDIVSENNLDTPIRTKLNAPAPVTSVAGKTGAVALTSADVGLGNVSNTSISASAAPPASPAVGDMWIDLSS